MGRRRRRCAAERLVLQLLHGGSTRSFLGEIHGRILRCGLELSSVVLAHFIAVAASSGRLSYARLVFCQVRAPDLALFNAVIKAHSLSPSSSQESLQLFSLARRQGVSPDHLTFAPLLKSCSHIADLRLGRSIHSAIIASGFHLHLPVSTGTVEFYAQCGLMIDARKVFDEMRHRDVIVSNMMISGFCRVGDVDSGYRLFRAMGERTVVSWNSTIACLARGGRQAKALELFGEMWDAGFEPDDATLVTVLPLCALMGALEVGRWIHLYADQKGLFNQFINVGNSLIDMYFKCSDLVGARTIFDSMRRRNVVSWNTMINGLAFNGRGEDGVIMFEKMTRHGVEPNAATFVGVLGCCRHAGFVDKGRELFDSIRAKHGIELNIEHYGCMVDLLGRCGFVREALELIISMRVRPNAAIWGALLSSCRTYANVDVAEVATRELIELEPWNSGNYVLLSNLYAEAGRWNDVDKLRLLMKERCVQKALGHSKVELAYT